MEGGYPIKASANMAADLQLTSPGGYDIIEVFANKSLGQFKPLDNFTCFINPTGVYLIKAQPVKTLTALES